MSDARCRPSPGCHPASAGRCDSDSRRRSARARSPRVSLGREASSARRFRRSRRRRGGARGRRGTPDGRSPAPRARSCNFSSITSGDTECATTARRGGVRPGRRDHQPRQLTDLFLGQSGLVERASHAELARRLTAGAMVARSSALLPSARQPFDRRRWRRCV